MSKAFPQTNRAKRSKHTLRSCFFNSVQQERVCFDRFPQFVWENAFNTRFSLKVWVILSASNAPAIVLGPNDLSATLRWLKQRNCFYSILGGWVGRSVRQENEEGQHTTNGGSKGYTYRMMAHRVRIDVVVPAMCSTSPRAILVLPGEPETVHHHKKLTEIAKPNRKQINGLQLVPPLGNAMLYCILPITSTIHL